jgi:hypothetical protein
VVDCQALADDCKRPLSGHTVGFGIGEEP